MKWIDLPPVWLAAFIALAWAQARWLSLGLSFGPVWADVLGWALILAGLVLAVLAALEFRRHRTTIIPHREADSLVTTGVFSRSRNPIYLADSLILTGVILTLDAVASLPLVPVFMAVISRRFIKPEEQRLRRKFVARFDAYAQQVRRWL